jgi:heterodisulfide reductase subunit A
MSKKEFEEQYRISRKKALFLRYSLDKIPHIAKGDKSEYNFKIRVFEHNLKEEVEFFSDLIVLSSPLEAPDTSEDLSKMLKVPRDQSGFFLEAHVKLRPLDFATDGIFLCGCAHWPKNIPESIAQANGAAGRAIRILGAKEMVASGLVAEVNEELCVSCGVCVKLCPYNAISKDDMDNVSVNKLLCKGCGVCGASCPESAIIIHHFTNDQILSEIIAYGGE